MSVIFFRKVYIPAQANDNIDRQVCTSLMFVKRKRKGVGARRRHLASWKSANLKQLTEAATPPPRASACSCVAVWPSEERPSESTEHRGLGGVGGCRVSSVITESF